MSTIENWRCSKPRKSTPGSATTPKKQSAGSKAFQRPRKQCEYKRSTSKHVEKPAGGRRLSDTTLCLTANRAEKAPQTQWLLAAEIRTGTCEKIDLGNFSGHSKGIPTPHTWLIRRLLMKRIVNADSGEVANL